MDRIPVGSECRLPDLLHVVQYSFLQIRGFENESFRISKILQNFDCWRIGMTTVCQPDSAVGFLWVSNYTYPGHFCCDLCCFRIVMTRVRLVHMLLDLYFQGFSYQQLLGCLLMSSQTFLGLPFHI